MTYLVASITIKGSHLLKNRNIKELLKNAICFLLLITSLLVLFSIVVYIIMFLFHPLFDFIFSLIFKCAFCAPPTPEQLKLATGVNPPRLYNLIMSGVDKKSSRNLFFINKAIKK